MGQAHDGKATSPVAQVERTNNRIPGSGEPSAWDEVPVKPVLQALVLAERVYEIKGGRHVIAGTFSGITLRKKKEPEKVTQPDGSVVEMTEGGGPGAPWAFISLTAVRDGTVLSLQFVSLNRNKVLFSSQFTVHCKNPLTTVEITGPLPNLGRVVKEPGTYAFEVVCEGEILGSLRLVARIVDDPSIEE